MNEQEQLEKLEFEGNTIGIIPLDNQKLIPVKVICEILDLDHVWQTKNLQESLLFSGILKTTKAVAADGSKRDMLCIPALEVEHWIHSVSDTNRTPEQLQKKTAFLLWFRQQRHFFYQTMGDIVQKNKQELVLKQLISKSRKNVALEKNKLKKYEEALAQVHEAKYGNIQVEDQGEYDFEQAAINQIPESEADMLRLLLNNRSYISKSKKIPSRSLEVHVREKQNQEIERRMHT
ncbi:hypothetical protein HUW51_10175 [Adhaeribacter swui]|uniref:Antirepressor protein ant N-terminal domain-containing protein n=1 Tax=Adhaeribacter swui TaxID=2086471 RepID=A0A7G7G7E4_9BACT|nr:phage antirepressor N-terminal domain-containing protein [Adhaeribacter swui]QNF33078.1 hypothetical protein HUW51_10175 [Adhaeribacter swui]